MSRDDEIDHHLRRALQHAPDRDLAPPATLDQAVLAAARQAAQASSAGQAVVTSGATAFAASPRPSWQGWLAGLMRPAASATLATVVLASVVGWLWDASEAPEQRPQVWGRHGASAHASAPNAARHRDPRPNHPGKRECAQCRCRDIALWDDEARAWLAAASS